MKKTYTCPVCGYDKIENPIFDSSGDGTYEICPCCGFEFGFDDYPNNEKGYNDWRKNWIENNYPWFSKYTKKPENWEPEKQLAKILKNKINNIFF